jgi:hypothetical protein
VALICVIGVILDFSVRREELAKAASSDPTTVAGRVTWAVTANAQRLKINRT